MENQQKNVHIIPIGLEIDRVLAGLKQYPTNYAVFLYGTNPKLDVEQKARNNGKKIEKMINATVTVRNEYVDHHDFKNAFHKLNDLFSDLNDEGYRIYVNISSGSRIVSSAAIVIAFMTNSIPYYIYPSKYNIPKTTTVLSKGYEDIIQIPTMTIESPTEKERLILNALLKKGGEVEKQNELISNLESQDFFPMQNEREENKKYVARKRAKLNRYLLNLSRRNFVSLKKEGRNVKVGITESGILFGK
jgi:hypothetical protein